MPSNATASSVLFARLLAKGRLRHLQLLVAIAESGSVRRAADQIGMSQPAATQSLADIEGLLDNTLFERHMRGMRLTPAGRALIPMARGTLNALRASADTLHALQDGASGVLRVGAIPAAVSGLLRLALPPLSERHPGLRIEVVEAPGEQLLGDVVSGRVDVALCRRPVEVPVACAFAPIAQDVPWVIAGQHHPLARRRRVALADLRSARWLLPGAGLRIRGIFEALFEDGTSSPPSHPISTSSLPLVLEMLRRDQLLCLIPRSLIEPFVQWGIVARVAFEVNGGFEGIGALVGPDSDSAAVQNLLAAMRKAAG